MRYYQTNHLDTRLNERSYRRRRNVSFHGRYGKNEYLKTKSHSLNAILEELYTFRPENYAENKVAKIDFDAKRRLIPRIKLKRNTRSLKEKKSFEELCKMSSESEIIIGEDSTNSSLNDLLKTKNTDISGNRSENTITKLLNDQNYSEISSKSDENYFTKNFDDCMKRLQQIEKEHELIENEDKNIQFCILEKKQENAENDTTPSICNRAPQCELKNYENSSSKEKEIDWERQSQNYENDENLQHCLQQNSLLPENISTAQTEENNAFITENKQTVSSTWYSNLKQQFEKTDLENQESKTREMSCRITGATLKNNKNEKSKSEDFKEKDTRHYFSRLVKTNKSLIDEELPDPDKVKHIRAMFQETLNSTLKKEIDKKLGGSLQNISFRVMEQQMSRPLSAQCYRNDAFCEIHNIKCEEDKERTMKKISLKGQNEEFQIENTKKKSLEKYERDLTPGKECRNKRILQPKWTDTGSMSSGISSDLSSYDTDIESYSREGTEHDENAVSDDDLLEEVKYKHYVQNEVLEKIRSFGTSVTYYGGEMITCSVGPLLSPTTQAIMEEIGENYASDTSPIRSFDEFYRKYKETNDHNRKKKVGRTRSFGQNDVFQKPNVLNNTEIEIYKNDLEIEIGIKKPAGIPQNSLKRKVTKTIALGSKMKTLEKTKEKNPGLPISTRESDKHCDSTKDNKNSRKDLETVCDTINKHVNEDTSVVTKPKAKTKFEEEVQNHADILKNTETESEADAAKKEPLKPAFEKEHFYMRSKSTPEGFPSRNATLGQSEFSSNNTEHPAKEIYFSYEKSIFNKKRNSDMEFEEYEICDSLSEKLEKLEKKNSFEMKTSNQDFLLSKTPDNELSKLFQKTSEEEIDLDSTVSAARNAKLKEIQGLQIIDQGTETTVKNENIQGEKKDSKYSNTKWPIETSVMVDIQKSSEQTPKIISNGKTIAKTKIRLF